MTDFKGQAETIGHFLQPEMIAMGQRVMVHLRWGRRRGAWAPRQCLGRFYWPSFTEAIQRRFSLPGLIWAGIFAKTCVMYVIRTTFLMGLAMTLSACQPISGKLDVATNLAAQLIEYNGPVTAGCLLRDGGCGEPVIRRVSANFHPGTYDAHLSLGTGEALQLTVNDGTARHAVMKVEIPQSVELPRISGRFKIRASESGQPFDVVGDMETIEWSSPVRAGWEGCQRQVKRRLCEHAKTSAISKQRGVRCRHAYQTVYGHRAVEFHHLTRTLTVRLKFKNDTFADNIAEFNGASERKYKVYDYRGPCEFDNLFVRQDV